MTHSHDDSRQPPSADPADLDLQLVPEPLVPAEPPPPAVIEPSWRQILAMQTPPVHDDGPRAPEAPGSEMCIRDSPRVKPGLQFIQCPIVRRS